MGVVSLRVLVRSFQSSKVVDVSNCAVAVRNQRILVLKTDRSIVHGMVDNVDVVGLARVLLVESGLSLVDSFG